MADDQQIEEVAAMMFAAALAFTDTIGRRWWSWEAAAEADRQYWRNIAIHARAVFDRPE